MKCINCGAQVQQVKWRGRYRGRSRQTQLNGKIPGWRYSVFTCSNRCVLALRKMGKRIL